jgi:DNA invertase Pin-like site-specific DNA recombinase
LLVTMLAAVAEFERELIRERTGEGRKRAMQNGVRFGRKPKLSDFQRKEALARRGAGETLAQIARSYAVSVSMISRLFREGNADDLGANHPCLCQSGKRH